MTDIAVVGAGPAGLAAALEAARSGARVTIIDEYAMPGGQYFRQPQAAIKRFDETIFGKSVGSGRAFIKTVAAFPNMEIRPETLVWGAFDDGVLELESAGFCERLRARRIIVATGAYERPIPFPGWTLPGVMTAGGAQTLLKSQLVLPGSRILLSGTGPFQLPVAAQLARAGGNIVGILEARPFRRFFGPLPSPWRHLDKIVEAAGYLATLASRRVPLRYAAAVVEARGDGRVEEAVVASLDSAGRPNKESSRTIAVDSLLVNYGFVPALQLPRLLGCRTEWDADGDCWVAWRDADQRSSIPHVFVAGETTGVAGHRVALAEGAIAGLHAAADLGFVGTSELATRASGPRRARARHQQFADHLKRVFHAPDGLYDLVTPDTIVCRCEEASAGQIVAIAVEWGGSIRAIKQCTRAGMGQCQGRLCESSVLRLASRASGKGLAELGQDTPRPQIKPISLAALAEPVVEV